MKIDYQVEGLPDDLPTGEYATRVKSANIVTGGILIVLEFAGDIRPNDPTLFTITKHEDETITNN